jgi:hypothetical protein
MRLIDADKLEDSVICSVCFWDDDDEDLILDAISQQPTVDAAPVVHGRWEAKDDGMGDYFYRCSACGAEFDLFGKANFCPECGSKMDLEATYENH